MADLANHPGVLRDGNELSRAQQSSRRVAPPDERLESADLPALQGDDRLIHDNELARWSIAFRRSVSTCRRATARSRIAGS